MKKSLLVISVLLTVLVTLSIAGFAYAQSNTPPTPETPYRSYGYGYGMHGWSRGGMMWGIDPDAAYGPMHDEMLETFADALGLSVDELNAEIENGNTMWDIARQQGLSDEEIYDLMFTARAAALEQAVADGFLTQEQADWMIARMDTMHAGGFGYGGYGPGACHGGIDNSTFSGQRGPGGRWNNQPIY